MMNWSQLVEGVSIPVGVGGRHLTFVLSSVFFLETCCPLVEILPRMSFFGNWTTVRYQGMIANLHALLCQIPLCMNSRPCYIPLPWNQSTVKYLRTWPQGCAHYFYCKIKLLQDPHVLEPVGTSLTIFLGLIRDSDISVFELKVPVKPMPCSHQEFTV